MAAQRGGCTLAQFCQPQEPQNNYVCDRDCLVNLREIQGVNARVEALKEKVVDILDQVRQRGQVEKFYIGKTYVDKKESAANLDAMDPETWKKDGISNRWQVTYKPPQSPKNCDGLIVLTVVTKDMLPHEHTDQQDYAIMLEQRLLHYYKIEAYDPKIKNDSFGEGNRGEMHDGFAVYVAVKLENNGGLEQQFGDIALDD